MRVKLDYGAYRPERAHCTDAGLDLKTPFDGMVPAHGKCVVHTGVHVELPHKTAGVIMSKSGLNVLADITTTGLIDEGYGGEIVVKLYNHGDNPLYFRAGDKIAQLIVVPVLYEDVEVVQEINMGTRGAAGFGSTGR